MSAPTVRPLLPDDRDAWRALYRGYGEFYGRPKSEDDLDALWARVLGPAAEIEAYVAVDGADRAIGLAHTREFPWPLAGTRGLYLDDLFVDPGHRGTGAGRALLAHLRTLAHERGLGVVRWITREDNATARRLYDSVATATPLVTYDMAPEAG
jgi:ribosomal protein S18 acetylase RimI-like enzyme